MDVSNTNGGDHSLALATVKNDVQAIHAAAKNSIWNESELKNSAHLDTLPTSPAAISTPQPAPKNKPVELPITCSAEVTPNNAHIALVPELPIDVAIAATVALPNLEAVTGENLLVILPEENPQQELLLEKNQEQQQQQQIEDAIEDEEEMEGSEETHSQQTQSEERVDSESIDSHTLVDKNTEKETAAEKANDFIREVSPSMLTANEEMLSEDEDDEHMETHLMPHSLSEQQPIVDLSKDSVIAPESCSSGSHHSSPPPYVGSDSDLTTSGIVSSFNADSFLLDPSSRECSEGVSPDKSLVSGTKHVPTVPAGVASFTSEPIDIPINASPAPMDMSIHNFPKRHRHVHRAAVYAMHPYHRATCRGGTGVSVAKTLDLLKAVMQSSFNQEIKKLCDDYFQIYGMAAVNIHENTGDNIPPSTLRILVCKMLEEAMQGYQNNKWEFSSLQLPKNERVSEYKGSPMSTKKSRTEKESSKNASVGKRGRKPTEKAADSNRSAWKWSLDKRRLDPVKWSIDKLNADTKFVLGVNVNKALGHAANRGKVYILHPQLFKYVCDGDDKTWLFDNKYMPVHGGKAFLMIFDEVEILIKSDENYKGSSEIMKSVQNLKRFTVPLFMLTKMRDFVKHVQGFFAQESASQSAAGSSSSTLPPSEDVK